MGMASLLPLLLSFLLVVGSVSADTPSPKTSFRPRALLLPVAKDESTHQYFTRLRQRTPLVQLILAVDLGGEFMWVNCERDYKSTTYSPVLCRTPRCKLAGAAGCTVEKNSTCVAFPDNPFHGITTTNIVAEDIVSVASTNGYNPGPSADVPRFIFVCGSNILLPNLTRGATGIVGLSRSPASLPSQFASAFRIPRKFAMCLPSSTAADGVIFFGDGPYHFLLDVDASRLLTYTPLYINPVSTAGGYSLGDKSVEYFIGVRSITIGEKPLKINATLLKIDKKGKGGTKISTVNRFTLLQTSIYREFTAGYIRAAHDRNISRVPSVAPFGVCFSTANVFSTRVGPSVPYVTLELDGPNRPIWTITGSNSMVRVNDKALCLGFMDGGENPRTAIVIGGLQLEDNLLQFDLAGSRFGFTSTLLGRQTTCANFNFTASA